MEVYDIFMLVVLIAATYLGARRGLAWQAASLAALVVGYFVALRFSPLLAPLLARDAPWNRFLAMLLIYVLTALVIWLGLGAVRGIIDRVKLTGFDRPLPRFAADLKTRRQPVPPG